jgi:hypothetical protein
MSDHIDNNESGRMSRRAAIATGAKVAGAAAFATPVVMGVFSSAASAQVPERCDPSIDSDAIDILEGGDRRWNLNCEKQDSFAGRYNAQRTELAIPGTNEEVVISFGLGGVDNFAVECSFYTITAPDGYECTATFAVENANGTPGCTSATAIEAESTPGDCTEGFPSNPDFTPPPGALPLPYCYVPGGTPNACDSGNKLVLESFFCCPPA